MENEAGCSEGFASIMREISLYLNAVLTFSNNACEDLLFPKSTTYKTKLKNMDRNAETSSNQQGIICNMWHLTKNNSRYAKKQQSTFHNEDEIEPELVYIT